MTNQYVNGADALNALNETGGGNTDKMQITSLSGATFKVKVVDKTAVQLVYAYGIHGKSNNGRGVNSFVAQNPSKKSKNGYPVEDLTSWDMAWKYHKDRSTVYTDAEASEANKYRAKKRFVMAFYELSEGTPILFDLSERQAKAVASTIAEYADELGELAFEIKKVGEKTETTAALSPIVNMAKKLTADELANFENAPTEFPAGLFDGIWFEKSDADMVELLKQAGFNVALIGLDASAPSGTSGEQSEDTPPPGETPSEDDLPF